MMLVTILSIVTRNFFTSIWQLDCQGLRIFTNGIIWWGQDRFRGDQYAGDVIMVCKHLRSIFRWHCLEVLPHWVWAGEDGKGRPPAEPIPATEEEWEAEVGIWRFFRGAGDADNVLLKKMSSTYFSFHLSASTKGFNHRG